MNESLGPRTPCRVCKDLSLYGIHWWCEQAEIEMERAAMDQDDGSETDRGLDLGGSSGCAGGCEEDP